MSYGKASIGLHKGAAFRTRERARFPAQKRAFWRRGSQYFRGAEVNISLGPPQARKELPGSRMDLPTSHHGAPSSQAFSGGRVRSRHMKRRMSMEACGPIHMPRCWHLLHSTNRQHLTVDLVGFSRTSRPINWLCVRCLESSLCSGLPASVVPGLCVDARVCVCVCGGRGKKMIVVLCEGGTIIVVCV